MRKLLVALGGLFLCLTANAQNVAIGSLTAQGADCSTAGACITLQFDSNDVGSASIQLSGTFTATVQFEASSDKGTTWVAISGTPLNSTTAVTSATTANTWKFNVASITNIRARASAWTSAPTVVIRSSRAVANAIGGSGGGTVGPGTANTVAKFATSTTVGNSGLTDDGATITATEPFALSSTLNSVIPMQTAACPASGTAATVTWCADTGNLPAIEEGTGAKQYLSLQPNLTNDGTTGTTLNQLAKVNSSGNAINCLTTDTTVPCLPVNSNTATSGQAQLIANGIASCAFDATAVTAGDYVVASTTVAGKCHDATSTRPSGVWVVGQATTSGLASTTQSVLVDGAASGTGTVTSVATTGPITGGTITGSGTIACATCATTTNGGALSGTAPVTVSAAGVIACATCATTLDTVGDPAAAKSFNFANANFLTFGTAGSNATGTNNLVTITDGANNSGTGAVTKLASASGSNGFPLSVSLTGANTAAVTDVATYAVGGAPGTVSGVGLAGAGYHFTAQAGGTTSTTATNGGAGGGYSLTGGIGGATLSGNATGGAGGGVTIVTGAGGASSGTNANANGGDVTVTLGAAGAGGSGAAGRAGQLIMNGTWATTSGGATITPVSGQNVTASLGGSGSFKVIGTTTAGDVPEVVQHKTTSPTGDTVQGQDANGTAFNTFAMGYTKELATTQNSAASYYAIYMDNTSGSTIGSGAPVKMGGTADTIAIDATLADTGALGVNEASCSTATLCRVVLQGIIGDAISDGACAIGNFVQVSATSGDVHCVGTIGTVGTTIGIAMNAVNGAGFHFIILHE